MVGEFGLSHIATRLVVIPGKSIIYLVEKLLFVENSNFQGKILGRYTSRYSRFAIQATDEMSDYVRSLVV